MNVRARVLSWGVAIVLVAVAAGGCKKAAKAPGEEAYAAANDKIDSYKGTAAFGNTPAAQELAAKYSAVLKDVTKEGFTGGKGETFSTKGNVLVYRQQTDAGCAFLVHVPELKKYKDDVRDALAKYAWEVAQIVAAGTVTPGKPVAVGLRGTLLYGPVMTGKMGSATPEKTEHAGTALLHPFFVAK